MTVATITKADTEGFSGTSFAINLPAGNPGHHQLASFLVSKDVTLTPPAPAVPGEVWIREVGGDALPTYTDNFYRLQVWRRVLVNAVGGGTTQTWTASSSASGNCRVVNSTGPFDKMAWAQKTTFGTAPQYHTVPDVDPTSSSDNLLLAIIGTTNWPRTHDPASGWTIIAEGHAYLGGLTLATKAYNSGTATGESGGFLIYDQDNVQSAERAMTAVAVFGPEGGAPPASTDTLDLYIDSSTVQDGQEAVVTGRYKSNGAAVSVNVTLRRAVTNAIIAMAVTLTGASAAPTVPGYTPRANKIYFNTQTGNDSTGNGTSGNPYKSPKAKFLAGAIPDGTEIIFKNGTQTSTVDLCGNPNSWPRKPQGITFRSESYQGAIIKNTGQTVATPFWIVDWSNWEIWGLGLEDWHTQDERWPSDGGGAPVEITGNCANWRIVGNRLRNNGSLDTNQELMHSFYLSSGSSYATTPRNFVIAHNDIDSPSSVRNGAGLMTIWHADGVFPHDGIVEWNKVRGKWTYGIHVGSGWTTELTNIKVRNNDLNASFYVSALQFDDNPSAGGVDSTFEVTSNILCNTLSTGKAIRRDTAAGRPHTPTITGNVYFVASSANAAACLQGITVDGTNTYAQPSSLAGNEGTFVARAFPPPGDYLSQASGTAGTAVVPTVLGHNLYLPGIDGTGYMPFDMVPDWITLGPDYSGAVGSAASISVVDSNGWRRAGVALTSSDPTGLEVPATTNSLGRAVPTLRRAGRYIVNAELNDPVRGKLTDSMVFDVTSEQLPVDTIPPTAVLAVSATNIISRQALQLTAVVSDNVAVTRVEFLMNGEVLQGGDINAPAEFKLAVDFQSSSANGTYSFACRAHDAAGNHTTSLPVQVVVAIPPPVTRPAAPSNIVVKDITATSITLSITDNASDETGFIVERRIGADGQWVALPALPAHSGTGAFEWTDTELASNTPYHYRVRARGPVGGDADSGTSDVVITGTLPATTAGSLKSVHLEPLTLAGIVQDVLTLRATARDNNGSAARDVTLIPAVDLPGIAAVSPASATTDANGQASFSVRLVGAGQAVLGMRGVNASAQVDADGVPIFSAARLTSAQLDDLITRRVDPRYDEETFPLPIEWDGVLGETETLVGSPVKVECVCVAGVDPAAATMPLITQVSARTTVHWIRGGVPGCVYVLRCTMLTSIGARRVEETRFRVFQTIGRRSYGNPGPVVQ